MTQHVDYDKLAPTYNQRFEVSDRPATVEALRSLLPALAEGSSEQGRSILEVGCGTARWLAELCGLTGSPPQSVPPVGVEAGSAHCYGLDPSTGMLAQAQQRGAGLHLVRGRGESLPFPNGTLNLVYCVNAIHHMDGQQTFIHEARHVLRSGGMLAVIGSDPHGRSDSWYVYDYFAGIYEKDMARFPSWETVLNWMLDAGFESVALRPVERITNQRVGRSVFDDPFLQKSACSQLAMLSDEAYAAGLRRISKAIEAAEAAGEAIYFNVDLPIKMALAR